MFWSYRLANRRNQTRFASHPNDESWLLARSKPAFNLAATGYLGYRGYCGYLNRDSGGWNSHRSRNSQKPVVVLRKR